MNAPFRRKRGLEETPHSDMLRAALSGEGLLSRFGYMMASQLITVGCGVGYWMIATRLVTPRNVGLATAAVSTGGFLAGIGIVGISSLMLVETRAIDPSDLRRVVSTATFVGGVLVALLGSATWALSPYLGPSLRAVGANPLDAALFIVGASATTIGMILDAAAIGLRRGPAQLARNAVVALARLVLVLVLVRVVARDATGLLLAWVIATTASLVVAPAFLRLPRPFGVPARRRGEIVRRYGGLALRHHVLNLAITSVSFFLPFIAALAVRPDEYAYFSAALLVSSTVLLPPALLAMTLFAEAAGDASALRRHIRRTLTVGFGCCFAVLAVLEPLAPVVLRLFGHGYSAHGATLLRLLLVGGVPYVIKDHYVSIRRAEGRLSEAARVVAAATTLEVAGAAIGAAFFGVLGLCAGWAIATTVESVRFAPIVRSVAGPLRRDRRRVLPPDLPAPSLAAPREQVAPFPVLETRPSDILISIAAAPKEHLMKEEIS